MSGGSWRRRRSRHPVPPRPRPPLSPLVNPGGGQSVLVGRPSHSEGLQINGLLVKPPSCIGTPRFSSEARKLGLSGKRTLKDRGISCVRTLTGQNKTKADTQKNLSIWQKKTDFSTPKLPRPALYWPLSILGAPKQKKNITLRMARENKTEGIQDWKIPTGWKYGPYRHTRGISFPPLKKDPATFQPLICTNTSPIVGHFRPLNLRTKIIALTSNKKSKKSP